MPYAVIEGGLSAKNAIEIPGLTVDEDGTQRIVIQGMDFDTIDLLCNITPRLSKYLPVDYAGEGTEIIDYDDDRSDGNIELVFGAVVAKADIKEVIDHADYIRETLAA